MSAPGRLKVEEGLSGIRVRLPGEQILLQAVYWGGFLVLLGGTLVASASGSGGAGIGDVLFISLCLGGMALGVWVMLSTLVSWVQSGSRVATGALLLGGLGMSAPFVLSSGDVPLAWVLAWVFSGLFYFVLLRLLAAPAAEVTIDASTVEVRHRKQRVTVPLETITAVSPAQPWRSRAKLGRVPVPGMAELRDEEWAWLSGTILESAKRRRAALSAEGHDLAEEARPPAALQGLTVRRS